MAVLFLDPLLLGLVVAVVVYAWLVWHGRIRRWFGQSSLLAGLAWPGPPAALVVLAIAGSVAEGLAALGTDPDRGTALTALIYLLAYGVPLVWLTLSPPRRLLPRWARERIAVPPSTGSVPATDAIPAVNAGAGRGHGALTRWAWRVDGTPGYLHLDGGRLQFRAAAEIGPLEPDDLDDDAVDQLALSLDDELKLQPPRGGWWTRRHTDVELGEVDALRVRATRRGGSDAVLVVSVDGRRPLHLWVADRRALDRALQAATWTNADPAGDGPG